MDHLTSDKFDDAGRLLEGVAVNHPLQYSATFSARAGSRVLLKPECLQKNGCHKIRGAYT